MKYILNYFVNKYSGLLLVVLLLGHGLVALPKKYWLEKNNEVNLKYCYF